MKSLRSTCIMLLDERESILPLILQICFPYEWNKLSSYIEKSTTLIIVVTLGQLVTHCYMSENCNIYHWTCSTEETFIQDFK